MAGRPPKPTELLLLTGAARKNPKRLKARAGEPEPPKLPVDPPAAWRTMDALACHAEMLFREEKSLNEIAAELKVTWEEARELRDRRKLYVEWDQLRGIWAECLAMWPWLTYSDSGALKRYCKLVLKEDNGTATASDQRLAQSLCTQFGGTGAGRAHLGVRAAGSAATTAPKSIDKRQAFLAQQKTG